ncbi:uncharacterized protein LOC119104859 [Pollicipes pollicipes]|uniref:uncharacterized protein LOC119104859 n=1 Tax=Pollicipes pollicipes TaxID=41117 RepID=UPI0018849177|nr:uncharacterized protein LOC119104859 [Pollicipes pollicipes]
MTSPRPALLRRRVDLNINWFNDVIQRKLRHRMPFQQRDWNNLVSAIFNQYFSATSQRPANPKRWYHEMSARVMDEYPHLFEGMTTFQGLTFVTQKLRCKFKNVRFKINSSWRALGLQRHAPSSNSTPTQQLEGTEAANIQLAVESVKSEACQSDVSELLIVRGVDSSDNSSEVIQFDDQ